MSFQFNEAFYLTNNTDVFVAVANGQMESGLAHYNQFGWGEGRDPNPYFDTSYYVSQNPDVANAVLAGDFASPLQHFLLYGAAEGRAPSASAAELLTYFDESAYLAANPDVAQAIADGDLVNAEQHWLLYGQFENRAGGPELPPVGETFTLTQSPDTGAAFTGGDGDDVFNAPAEQTGLLPIQTLGTADNIDGGGGRNTLNAQLVDPYVIPAGLWNIHEVNISSPGGILPLLLPAPTLDVLNADSIDTINFRNSMQSITINNLSTALDTVGIYDEFPNPPFVPVVAHTINHVGAATDGTDDALAINLRNATGSTLTLNHASLDPNAGYEIFEINSMGSIANVFTLVNLVGGPRDVTVQGNNALTLNGISFNTLRTFDATALMAPLVANFPGGNSAGENVDITGSTFANTMTFTGTGTGTGILTVTTFDGNDTLAFSGHSGEVVADLGEGNNTLTSTGGSGHLQANAGEGNDTFTVDTHTGDVTIDGGDGNNTFNIAGTGTTGFSGIPLGHVGDVAGIVSLTGGDGDDTFNFYQLNNATNFNAGDSVDGGGGDNDLLRFDVFNPTNGAVNLLVPGTTIANIESIRVTGDLFGDLGGVLNVDWANSGSANRLELAANALGVVTVTNLDFANGDTVAVYPIANIGLGPILNLTLVRGFVTAPAFNLELNDGVIVHILNVGTGSDLLNLVSLGDPAIDINSIFDASNINAGVVVITGDTDLLMGNSLANAFDHTVATPGGVLIDLSGFTGDAFIGVNEGLQTINDGSGDDLFVVYRTGNLGNDRTVVNLSADGGADTVSFSDAFGTASTLAQNHLVTGFDLAADQVMLNLHAATTLFNQVRPPEATDGTAITSQDLVIREIQQGEIANLSASNINFLKFVAPAIGTGMAGTVDALFDAAIGLGALTISGGTSAIFGAAYDSVAEAMVLFQIINFDNNGLINAADNAEGIAVIDMSYDDFLAFDASNLYFDNTLLVA